MTNALIVINAAKSTQQILNFVSGNSLKQAICKVTGDIHIDAAKLALESSRVAINQKDRINSAITHLETAHISFQKVHYRASNFFAGALDYQSIFNAVYKDVWVCSILSLCYASLNEKCLVEKYLDLGTRAWRDYDHCWNPYNYSLDYNVVDSVISRFGITLAVVPLSMCGLFNPNNYNPPGPIISREDYEKFKLILIRTVSGNLPPLGGYK